LQQELAQKRLIKEFKSDYNRKYNGQQAPKCKKHCQKRGNL